MSNNLANDAIEFHRSHKGKIETKLKAPLETMADLRLAYTPGVGSVSTAVANDPSLSYELTNRGNSIAIVSDGSAVLGLGNIGPEAAMPVMEGKAAIFKAFANIDAVPICLNTQNPDEIIAIVQALEPTFAGINLEDIKAPECFLVEKTLRSTMNIPVFHDDQHGTAIVVLAGLLNAHKVVGRELRDARIVISGAGAAGISIAELLLSQGVKDVILVDSKGVLSSARTDVNQEKQNMIEKTNPRNISGALPDALRGATVFVGVSAPGILTEDMVRSMAADPIVFAMANPVPEIMPDEARRAGAAIVATGRSDFPNQVNNALAFPGIFRGLLDGRKKNVTQTIEITAAHALANIIAEPTAEQILPNVFDTHIVPAIAEAVKTAE